MRTGRWAALLGLAVLCLTAPAVRAEPRASAPDAEQGAWHLTLSMDGALYLSDVRSVGGAGGGLGLRHALSDTLFVEGDVAGFFGLGNGLRLRLGVGAHLPGLCAPAITLRAGLSTGGQLRFSHSGPVGSELLPRLGLAVAPARFDLGHTTLTLFELGVMLGLEAPTAPGYEVTLLRIGIRLG